MILFLHNRYRTTGGEERVVQDLMSLVEEQLHERAQLLARDSATLSKARAAAALIRGGERPADVAAAVRLCKARVVHAHNLHPLLGWRSLAAARQAGAKVVLHLHQYRLVCAVGVCFTAGQPCTRCHGRNTLPGLRLNCRGSVPEALSYAAALSLWQRRLAQQADAIVVPSAFAKRRLAELAAPIDCERVHVLSPPVRAPRAGAAPASSGDERTAAAFARPAAMEAGSARSRGGYALVVSRLAVEKGVDIAIDACIAAGRPLVIAGDGPERERLQERAAGVDVRFLGAVSDAVLSRLREGAALALVPSRSAETFGIAAAEAMAAGLPVLASDIGAIPELVSADALVPAGDAAALAAAIERTLGDAAAGERNRKRVAELCAPQEVARRLAAIYDKVCAP
jgi:glycosyltransferase involved in cell wall biosynthesis